MKYIIGLFIALLGFYQAGDHLDQSVLEYWDAVAFFVVVFGTVAVLAISFPSFSAKELLSKFIQKFIFGSDSLQACAKKCAIVISKATPVERPKLIEEQLLNDGLELISLGFSKEKIEELLIQRYQSHARKINLVSNWLKRNAKYPPAFGLAGTVLGLIHLMRGISTGLEAKDTGIRMAVALVATLYGLILSNLILNPLSEWFSEELKKDEVKCEMVITSIINLRENANILEIQEMINSYLEPANRLDLISSTLSEEAA